MSEENEWSLYRPDLDVKKKAPTGAASKSVGSDLAKAPREKWATNLIWALVLFVGGPVAGVLFGLLAIPLSGGMGGVTGLTSILGLLFMFGGPLAGVIFAVVGLVQLLDKQRK